jgi:hypothetical protein
MERHLALVAIAEIRANVGRPLVRFREDEAVGVVGVDCSADGLDDGMRLRQVFAGGAVALQQIGNGVHAQRVHAHIQPEAHGLQDFVDYQGAVKVEIRLVRKKAVPVKSLGGVVPRPIRFLGIREDDAGVFVELIGLRPDVHVALRRAGRCQARSLEPWVLIAGVVDDQLNHHLHVALVSRVKEYLEIVQRSIRGIDVGVV